MTFRLTAAGKIRERGLFAPAFIRGIGAARVQQAAVGTVIFPRHHARQRGQTRFILGELRQRAQQRLGLRMARRAEDIFRVTGLHHLTRVHNDNFMRGFRHQRQVVGDQHQRHILLLLQIQQ